jgi:hypothetical protein
MSTRALIEQLYEPSECKTIQALYEEDPSVRVAIREAIGTKIILDKEKIISEKPLDAIYLVCLTAKFAASEDECHKVALTIYQYHDKPLQVLPSIAFDAGLKFAHKALIALSFHPQALEKKWKYHGAPRPGYYRDISKIVFSQHGEKEIAAHHEQWEMFLGEMFV